MRAALRETVIVGNENQGGAGFLIQFEHEIDHRSRRPYVEIAGGFIREQQDRSRAECPRQGHALLFAAGQLTREMSGPCRQANPRERGTRGVVGLGSIAKLERQ